MINKIKNMTVAMAMVFSFGAATLAPVALVQAESISEALCQGTNSATEGTTATSGCTTSGNGEQSIASIANTVVNYLSIIVGVIAVIMIIVGGFKYITSGGESGNVSGAKNTLIYAIVGLIIVALAQFIVHFVLTGADKAVPGN